METEDRVRRWAEGDRYRLLPSRGGNDTHLGHTISVCKVVRGTDEVFSATIETANIVYPIAGKVDVECECGDKWGFISMTLEIPGDVEML